MAYTYFPASETDFENWFGEFWAGFELRWQGWGLSEGDKRALDSAWANWRSAFDRPSGDRSTARAFAETIVTGIVNQLMSNPNFESANWMKLGFSSPPQSAGLGSPALHLHWDGEAAIVSWDEVMHPVWSMIQIESRLDGQEWEVMGTLPTRAPDFVDHSPESSRQYRACWVASSGSMGPWSVTVSAVAAAA